MEHLINALQRAKSKPVYNEYTTASPTGRQESGSNTYTHTRVIKTESALLHANRLINPLMDSNIYTAYRLLRTNVLQRMREKNWTTLGVTSPSIKSGKSLTAINLAISIALEVNQTVLLVDLDLRNPSVHQYFGYQPEQGLSDYIHSQCNLNEILINPSVERLVVLPGRESILNSSETLSAPRMVQLFSELKNRYQDRVIIFDLPPLLSSDDALVFSPYVDTFLMVIEDNKTQVNDLARAKDMLKQSNVLGTVLNKSSATQRQ